MPYCAKSCFTLADELKLEWTAAINLACKFLSVIPASDNSFDTSSNFCIVTAVIVFSIVSSTAPFSFIFVMISDHFSVDVSSIVAIIDTVAFVPQPPLPSAVIFRAVKASVTVRVPKAEVFDIKAKTALELHPPAVVSAKKCKAAILSVKFKAFQPLYP